MLKTIYAKTSRKVVSFSAEYKLWDTWFASVVSENFFTHKDNKIVYNLILAGQKLNENYELDLFKNYISPGMTVVDIGANLGLYTLVASKLVGKTGRVYAFEPEETTYIALQDRVISLHLNNVTLIPEALSNKVGLDRLYVDAVNVGGHSLSAKNPYKSDSYKEIRTNTLNEYFKEIKIDIIKIDTQGAEGIIMDGGKEVLKRDKPVIFLEFWPNGMDEFAINSLDLLDIFDSLGYKYKVLDRTNRTLKEVNRQTLYSLCNKTRHAYDYVDVILELNNI